MIRLFYIMVFLSISSALSAQIITSLSAHVDSVEIGDTIYLTYKAQYPSQLKLRSVDYRVFDSLDLFNPTGEESDMEEFTEMEWIDPDGNYEPKLKNIRGEELISSNRQNIFSDTLSLVAWDFWNLDL